MGDKIITTTFCDCLSWEEQLAFLERENADYAKYLARKKVRYEEGKTRRRVKDVAFAVIGIIAAFLTLGMPIYGLFL